MQKKSVKSLRKLLMKPTKRITKAETPEKKKLRIERQRQRRKLPHNKYGDQKQAAKQRGIQWLFTFQEWFEMWYFSGKWRERGCGRGQYCMMRNADAGPYSVDNVTIGLADDNKREAIQRKYTVG